MKKIIFIICAALMLCTFNALAETAQPAETATTQSSTFQVTTIVPEGYTYEENWLDEAQTFYYGVLTPEDRSLPTTEIAIAYDDMLDGETLTGITEADLPEFREMLLEDKTDVEVTCTDTEYGTSLLIITETVGSEKNMEIYTYYQGYEISIWTRPGEGSTELTEEQKALVVQFITDLWVVQQDAGFVAEN